MRIGTGADRQGEAQQLGDRDHVVGGHRQGAPQQGVIGVDVGVVQAGGVVILEVEAGGQAQRVVTLVRGLGVVRQRASGRQQCGGQQQNLA
ncbi:hypothetical protein D3C80_1793840 [compost metagenome]